MAAKRCALIVLVLMAKWGSAEAAPTVGPARVRDIALRGGGLLAGQLLDPQGVAIADKAVTVSKAGRPVANVKTDVNGRFQVADLSGGVYHVSFDRQTTVCRMWAPNTAPPAAQMGLMLVRSSDTVRGQCGCGTPVCGSPVCGSACGSCDVYGRSGCGGGVFGWMANHPVITVGGIAAAIAVPLAVDDDDPAATP